MKLFYKIISSPFYVYFEGLKKLANLIPNDIISSIVMFVGLLAMFFVVLLMPETYQIVYFIFLYVQFYCYEKCWQ